MTITIQWNASFQIGHAAIDEQHRRIVDTINKLAEEQKVDKHSETFTDAMTVLTQYSIEHFRYEEALLEKINYPELDKQIQHHKEFKKKIAYMCVDTANGKGNAEEEILKYLVAWWTQHILIEDMKYKEDISTVATSHW